jgi:hypothetical protein
MAKRKDPPKRQPLVPLEDLRDDCIAVMINSGLSPKQVRERGGPTPATTSKWLYRETVFPQLATIRAMLNACGHDLVITGDAANIQRIGYGGIAMPPKKKAKKKAHRRTATA